MPERRVFGRYPKLPIGAVGTPNFRDVINQNDFQATQTHQVLAKLRELQKAALESDIHVGVQLSLNKRVRGAKSAGRFLGGMFISDKTMTEIKRILNVTPQGLV